LSVHSLSMVRPCRGSIVPWVMLTADVTTGLAVVGPHIRGFLLHHLTNVLCCKQEQPSIKKVNYIFKSKKGITNCKGKRGGGEDSSQGVGEELGQRKCVSR
jgi:hypothetical protein